MEKKPTLVVALGGNALLKRGGRVLALSRGKRVDGGFDGLWHLLRVPVHATNGGPSGGLQLFLCQAVAQGIFDHAGGQGLVVDAGKHARNRDDGPLLFVLGQLVNRVGQGLASVFDAVEGQQDLQGVAAGLTRLRQFALPGLRGLQGGLARAGLQRNVHRTLKERRVAGLARRVQNERKARAGRTLAHIEFAQQQLIKQHRVE